MSEYLYSILSIGVFVAIAVLLSPDSSRGNLGKYISFIGAITVSIVILLPLLDILGSYGLNENGARTDGTNSAEKGAEYYANSAGLIVSELYEIPLSSIRAKVRCNDADGVVKTVLYVKEDVMLDKKEAGEILTNILGTDIVVEYYE